MSSARTARLVIRTFPRMLVLGAALLAAASSPAVFATAAVSEQRLWDHSHRLSASDRLQLEQRLNVAERRLGSPLYLFIVPKLHNETAAQMAERLLRELAPGDAGHPGGEATNPLLLLLAIEDRAAAIATGKGNAGLVPEVDAARITRRLIGGQPLGRPEGDHRPAAAIAGAIDAMVISGEATAARRRPLSPEDEDLPPADRTGPADDPRKEPAPAPSSPTAVATAARGDGSADDEGPLGSASGAPSTTDPESPPQGADPEDQVPTKPAGNHTRLGIASAIAAVVLVGLALRRRRNLLAGRAVVAPPPAGKPRLPSVIDRPPPHHRGPRDPTGRGR